MKLNDKSQVKFKLTDQGYLISEGVKLARVGPMEYLGSELGKDPRKVYDVYVDAEQLFNPDTMRSFEHTPITIQHPEEMEVNSKNWEELAVGHISNIRPSEDRQFLLGDSIVNSPRGISTIQSGMIEVSCGYDADIEEIDGKLTKVNIRGNHLAIVDEGRCGADCKINLNDGKPKKMAKHPNPILALLGLKTKDARGKAKIGDAKKLSDKKVKLADRKRRIIDSKADFDVKFKDVEEIVVSPDATDEEKLEAVQELQTVAADLQEEAIAIQEEAVAAVEQAEELAAQVTPADEETPVNDATVEEAAAEVAALQEEILEKDAKILELEEQLQALKDKEDQASSLNDAKASFAKVVFKDSMSAKEIKATAVASTGAYSFADAMKLQDCALNSAYAAAKTVHGKKSNVGSKFVGELFIRDGSELMKEFLNINTFAVRKSDENGNIAFGRDHADWIEIPEGAEVATLDGKALYFWKPSENKTFVGDCWVTCGTDVCSFDDFTSDERVLVIWQRATHPEELPLIDDEPAKQDLIDLSNKSLDTVLSTDLSQPMELEQVRQHRHYFIDVSDVDEIDFYEIALRYNVTDPCIQHILKKCLAVGQRGQKDFHHDLKDIYDTAKRMLDVHGLDS